MSARKILSLLADGEFHSGEELGAALSITRSAVWKQAKKLEDLQVELHSVKGRGYCIPGGLNLLEPEVLKLSLSEDNLSALADLQVHLEIDSTNRLALEFAAKQVPGFVCFAEQQSAGRGRRGRAWVSPFARNIYLSLTWAFDGGVSALEGLSLAVGVAASNALKELGGGNLELKWPNDLLHEGKKLGGILVEMSGEVSDRCWVVIGIGINLQMPSSAARDIDQPWTDLESVVGHSIDRNLAAGTLLNHIMTTLNGYQKNGFAAYRDDWQQMDAFKDQPVVLSTMLKQTTGIARGINNKGALLLETRNGIEEITGGEVSLRKQQQ